MTLPEHGPEAIEDGQEGDGAALQGGLGDICLPLWQEHNFRPGTPGGLPPDPLNAAQEGRNSAHGNGGP